MDLALDRQTQFWRIWSLTGIALCEISQSSIDKPRIVEPVEFLEENVSQ